MNQTEIGVVGKHPAGGCVLILESDSLVVVGIWKKFVIVENCLVARRDAVAKKS